MESWQVIKCGIVENTVNKTHIFEVNDFFL